MAVNFHQPSVYALFDATPVPLLTFAVSGLVTYANAAAKRHPGKPVETMSGNATIKSVVASATLGKLKLPYAAKIELQDGHHLEGQFLAGPAGLDIAFLGQSQQEDGVSIGSAGGPQKLKQVIELLRDELCPPMNLLSQMLKKYPADGPPADMAKASYLLNQRLMRLSDLVEVFGEDVLELNDRIEPQTLIEQACRELAERAASMGIAFDVLPPPQTLPPIYGSRKLISRAFHECLENALIHSRKEVVSGNKLSVEIRFTLSGTHVLIGVRNRGASGLKVGGTDSLQPFAAKTQTTDMSAPRLGLPLVQRIVGLHGGSMRLSSIDEDTVQVLMELPTGAPLRGQDKLGIAQAQRYAKDLAQLLSRRKKEIA